MVNNSPTDAGDVGLIRKIPWRRKWQQAPVFLPGEFHAQRSLVGYRPWGHEELDTSERAGAYVGQYTRACTHTHQPQTLRTVWFSDTSMSNPKPLREFGTE